MIDLRRVVRVAQGEGPDEEEPDEFWGVAGAGVLLVAEDTGRALVALRSPHVQEPGTWGIIGGAIDGGESPVVAVRRELREELGYGGSVDLHKAFEYRRGSFRYHNFVGVVPSEFAPSLNWETSRVRWVTVEELRALARKHFGLVALLKNSWDIVSEHLR